MSTPPASGKPKVLLMHHFLDPGPAILAEVAEVVTYPSTRPLDEQNIRVAAEGCIGIVSQLKDPIRSIVPRASLRSLSEAIASRSVSIN